MKKAKVNIIEGNVIEIKGSLARHEIVREVVNTFIPDYAQSFGAVDGASPGPMQWRFLTYRGGFDPISRAIFSPAHSYQLR